MNENEVEILSDGSLSTRFTRLVDHHSARMKGDYAAALNYVCENYEDIFQAYERLRAAHVNGGKYAELLTPTERHDLSRAEFLRDAALAGSQTYEVTNSVRVDDLTIRCIRDKFDGDTSRYSDALALVFESEPTLAEAYRVSPNEKWDEVGPLIRRQTARIEKLQVDFNDLRERTLKSALGIGPDIDATSLLFAFVGRAYGYEPASDSFMTAGKVGAFNFQSDKVDGDVEAVRRSIESAESLGEFWSMILEVIRMEHGNSPEPAVFRKAFEFVTAKHPDLAKRAAREAKRLAKGGENGR